jgi:AmmeMemoRadiSam system protein A
VTSGPPAADAARLAAPERAVLLGLARRAVEAAARGEAGPDVAAEGAGGALAAPGAAFVTLHLQGQLRGCIGTVAPRGEPLAQNVVAMARAAAIEDPRFPPLRPDELADVDLEISVLGPLVPVERPDEIVVGRDGLLVEEGFRRGLLLPQVPVEWGWSRETFLAQACAKAGLPADAWRRHARLFRFEAEVFGEPDRPS